MIPSFTEMTDFILSVKNDLENFTPWMVDLVLRLKSEGYVFAFVCLSVGNVTEKITLSCDRTLPKGQIIFGQDQTITICYNTQMF